MPIAVNVADLSAQNETMMCLLLGEHIRNKIVRDVAPGCIDGMAVELECDDEQAEAIVEVLRLKDPSIRAYREGPRGGWNKY
jgi:hypothetical protein